MESRLAARMRELERQPKSPDAWIGMARALREEGRTEEAIVAAMRATALAPDRAPAWRVAGELAVHLGMVEKPVEWLQEAARLEPNDVEHWLLLGQARLAAGDFDGAVQAIERARELEPGHPNALATLARVHVRRSRRDEAEALLAPFLGHDDPYIAMAWAMVCRKEPQRAVAVLRRALVRATGFTRVRLLHTLGTAHDALGQWDDAFVAFRQANDARNAPFDPDGHDAELAQAAKAWPAERCRAVADEPCRVAYIVGLPRSGTSLLEQMLGAHSAIHPGGELSTLANAERRRQTGVPADASLAALLRGAYAERAQGRRWITDKMPNNLLRLGLASRIAPGSVIVAVHREPLDVLWSCYRQCFSDRLSWSTRQSWLGRVYKAQLRLLEHYRTVVELPWVDLDYAEIVGQPEATVRKVLGAMDLELERACLSPHQQRRAVTTASVDEVRQPIHQRSLGRAEPYRQHLKPLLDELGQEA